MFVSILVARNTPRSTARTVGIVLASLAIAGLIGLAVGAMMAPWASADNPIGGPVSPGPVGCRGAGDPDADGVLEIA